MLGLNIDSSAPVEVPPCHIWICSDTHPQTTELLLVSLGQSAGIKSQAFRVTFPQGGITSNEQRCRDFPSYSASMAVTLMQCVIGVCSLNQLHLAAMMDLCNSVNGKHNAYFNEVMT